MCSNNIIINNDLLVLIQINTILFRYGTKHFSLVLGQEAQSFVNVVQCLLVLLINFFRLNFLFLFLLINENFVSLFFCSLILLLHLLILLLNLLSLLLVVHILLKPLVILIVLLTNS